MDLNEYRSEAHANGYTDIHSAFWRISRALCKNKWYGDARGIWITQQIMKGLPSSQTKTISVNDIKRYCLKKMEDLA